MNEEVMLLIKSLRCCIDGECSECPRFDNGIDEYWECSRQLNKDAKEMIDLIDKRSLVAGGKLNDYFQEEVR